MPRDNRWVNREQSLARCGACGQAAQPDMARARTAESPFWSSPAQPVVSPRPRLLLSPAHWLTVLLPIAIPLAAVGGLIGARVISARVGRAALIVVFAIEWTIPWLFAYVPSTALHLTFRLSPNQPNQTRLPSNSQA